MVFVSCRRHGSCVSIWRGLTRPPQRHTICTARTKKFWSKSKEKFALQKQNLHCRFFQQKARICTAKTKSCTADFSEKRLEICSKGGFWPCGWGSRPKSALQFYCLSHTFSPAALQICAANLRCKSANLRCKSALQICAANLHCQSALQICAANLQLCQTSTIAR